MALAHTYPVALAPELGQLVVVRDRHWVVTDVLVASQPSDGPLSSPPEHLVELTSVEDDVSEANSDLSVIWEVEVGARVLETATLPAPALGHFDEPGRLDAFIDAVRWGAITSADSNALQAPFRSGISIEDYQLDPVVRALRMPRVNLLIADDVGLGKTIEAGLVVQELLLRHRARTVVIVCPASLTLKWQSEMAVHFGLDFRIVDAECIRQLRRTRGVGTNPFRHFPRLIVSIDWLKRARGMGLIGEVLPLDLDATAYPRHFDLLIVDEVHQCAPAGKGLYARDSQRTEAIRAIAPHFEHRLFLSATPHNGYTESFTALLELLDRQRFARGVMPSLEQLAPVMVRRLKSVLREELPPHPDGRPRFPIRVIEAIEVDYPEAERQVHRELADYTRSRVAQARRTSSRTATEFVTLLLKKRLFSSPAAFASTLSLHMETLRSVTRRTVQDTGPQALRTIFDLLEEDVDTDAELEDATQEALATAARHSEVPTTEQWQLLDSMAGWASAARGRPDAKAARLLDWLQATCSQQDDTNQRWWNDERVIVFTEYRATQAWLEGLMSARGLTGDHGERLALLYGGMDAVRRERIKSKFQHHPSLSPLRILLATDAASEGIDLQLHCHRMVHVEIPFSPTRLEQRNGRIDRHLQRSPEVLIHHFVGKGWETAADGTLEADLGFLSRIAKKVDTIRDDLGAVGPVLAEQVEAKMLGRPASLDARPKRANATAAARALNRIERNLRNRIQVLRTELDESKASLGITPSAVERVVSTALDLAHQPPLVPATLVREDKVVGGVFEVGPLTGSWARAAANLADPLTGERRPITFDHDVATDPDDVVLAHLGHPLVARSMRLLRAEVWSSGSQVRLSRVSARVAQTEELAVVALARLVLTGGDGHRLHEEVIQAGGKIANGRFTPYRVSQLSGAVAAATDQAAPNRIQAQLVSTWPAIAQPLWSALEASAEKRAQSLESDLARAEHSDIDSITSVLTHLQSTITEQLRELDGSPGQQGQLMLFSPDEADQYQRDLAALRRRLEEIPAEIETEIAAIRRRYANPVRRVFPAAVSFLVPSSSLGPALGTRDRRGRPL